VSKSERERERERKKERKRKRERKKRVGDAFPSPGHALPRQELAHISVYSFASLFVWRNV